MKIIDAHAHIFERIAGFGRQGELRPIGNGTGRWSTGNEMRLVPEGYGEKDFVVESLLDIMEKHNVEKAILLQGSLYGFQNEYALEVCDKYPDKFKGSITVDPFCKDVMDILERYIEMGVKIFKFEISIGGGMMGYHENFIIDGKVMSPIYDRISKVKGATLVLDIGSPWMESCQPEAVLRISKNYPDLHIVVCHLLAPSLEDGEGLKNALPYLRDAGVWIDLSAMPWNIAPEEYPYPTALEYTKWAKNILGTDKIIWGTDSPAVLTKFKYQELIDYIVESKIFDEEELNQVFYNNAVDAYYL